MPDARILTGDCLDVLPTLPEASADSVVTDPPYELGFMGKAWDRSGVAFRPETWAAVLRVAKPGAYLLAFGGTRTYHRLTCAVEDGGWEIRDCLMWLYGTGFPKGRGCLKPAWEPIVLACKRGPRVLPLGIDGCRVGTSKGVPGSVSRVGLVGFGERPGRKGQSLDDSRHDPDIGRYPANVLHDGSDEVLEAFETAGEKGGGFGVRGGRESTEGYRMHHATGQEVGYGDSGTAARFFYCAKASKADRGENNTHPTVKPSALMRYLVRLVTPAGGTVLDPFAGSGTTGVACRFEGRGFVGVELDAGHAETARGRLARECGVVVAG